MPAVSTSSLPSQHQSPRTHEEKAVCAHLSERTEGTVACSLAAAPGRGLCGTQYLMP